MGRTAQPAVQTNPEEQLPEGAQRVEIDANKMIRNLQNQRAQLHAQIDMMTMIIEQKDEQIAALLSEKEG